MPSMAAELAAKQGVMYCQGFPKLPALALPTRCRAFDIRQEKGNGAYRHRGQARGPQSRRFPSRGGPAGCFRLLRRLLVLPALDLPREFARLATRLLSEVLVQDSLQL